MRSKGQKQEACGDEGAASIDASAAPRPSMLVEGEEAVALYARQISFNLAELEEQVVRLRDECARAKKLLRKIG